MVIKTARLAEAEQDRIASNQKVVLAALMDSADPNTPPTEDEILGLILGEMALMRKDRFGHQRAST